MTEALVEDASLPGEGPADSGLEFEIIDETSAEQVERERELLAPADSEASVTEAPVRDEPEPGAAGEPRSTAEPATEQTADDASLQPRTYSQGEVSKMQAAWARQIEDARQNAVRADDRLQQFNMDAAVEAMLKRQESELAPGVGAEKAEQIVRSPHNAALVRQSIANQQLLARSESERLQAIEQQERQARFVVAQTLASQHGVPSQDFELLASASTPKAMQDLAKRLGTDGTSAMRDRVPPETPQTQLENGYHAGPAPETSARRLERIRARPSWEWTEADLRYMKTGEMR